jgi:hypothetical protein
MTSQSNWLLIAEQASEEMDSAKLMVLVSKLCQAMDGQRQEKITPSTRAMSQRRCKQRAHAE